MTALWEAKYHCSSCAEDLIADFFPHYFCYEYWFFECNKCKTNVFKLELVSNAHLLEMLGCSFLVCKYNCYLVVVSIIALSIQNCTPQLSRISNENLLIFSFHSNSTVITQPPTTIMHFCCFQIVPQSSIMLLVLGLLMYFMLVIKWNVLPWSKWGGIGWFPSLTFVSGWQCLDMILADYKTGEYPWTDIQFSIRVPPWWTSLHHIFKDKIFLNANDS